MKKPPLLIITGPTAAGKSALAVELAKQIGGEIVSADSMQVYRKMDIGSAKITPEEMNGVPHHLIDIMDPTEPFDVTVFVKYAKEALAGIYERGHVPIVAGGTGFYIQALLYDIDFTSEENDGEYRKELAAFAEKEGAAALHERLAGIDPASAKAIHPNNVKRVIRALEYHRLTGERISEHNERERQREAAYAFRYFVLTDERKKLYEKIDARVDLMMEAGLYEEVKGLYESGVPKNSTAMQGLGYKELYEVFDGTRQTEDAVRIIKRDTRHFAKRQITWFKRERDVIWINKSDYDGEEAILAEIIKRSREIL